MTWKVRVVLLLFLALPLVGHAADGVAPGPAPQTPGQLLAEELAKAVAALVGLAVSAFLVWLRAWLKAKFELEIATLSEERARGITQDAILATEEWAAKRILGGAVVKWEEKASHAAGIVCGRLGASDTTARRLIDSVLPSLELGAAAALREGRRALEGYGGEATPGPDDRSNV